MSCATRKVLAIIVSDNGIGWDLRQRAHPGLGTSIVEALARQLHARVGVSNGPQGTTVSIIGDRENTPVALSWTPLARS
jgi:two-component sensor histidine kinase